MKEEKFKALSYCGYYVNANMLNKGIYATPIPFLYPKNTTIADMVLKAREAQKATGSDFITEDYFKNLSDCTLVSVAISKINEN